MKNIAVIGAGTMGNGIAHCFAQNGYSVKLIDTSSDALKKGVATINKNLDRLIKKGEISLVDKEKTLIKISKYTNISEAVFNVDLVIEAATENEDVKLEIFKKLDQY